MNDQQQMQADRKTAQTVRVAGLVIFAIGAIFAKIGTTSTAPPLIAV